MFTIELWDDGFYHVVAWAWDFVTDSWYPEDSWV